MWPALMSTQHTAGIVGSEGTHDPTSCFVQSFSNKFWPCCIPSFSSLMWPTLMATQHAAALFDNVAARDVQGCCGAVADAEGGDTVDLGHHPQAANA